jgi:hypothetical protein
MRKLQSAKTDLMVENSKIKAELDDLKSLSNIDKIATAQFGLTQNVSQRITLPDPVLSQPANSRSGFVLKEDIPDWLEQTVTGSGKVRAEPPKPPAKRIKQK